MTSSPPTGLADRIRDEIRKQGPISFARFQERALYEPDLGYYARGARIGRDGADFWTAPEISPAFGELIGEQVAEMATRLGEPADFQLVEFGAGTGSLAVSLLGSWERSRPELCRPGVYTVVETSPALTSTQKERLAVYGPLVRWVSPGKEESPPPGVLLMNEVLDALPVHRLVRRTEGWREIRVGLDRREALTEVEVPASEDLIRRLRFALPPGQDDVLPGQEAEVRAAYEPFLRQAAGCIGRGYLLVIDYGLTARELYGPSRLRGTVMAYHRHQAVESLLERPGEQDLTAHVDLDLVARVAAGLGFEKLGVVSQMEFLIALGLEEKMAALHEAGGDEARQIEQRLAMAALVRPGGMGEMFRVFIAGRDAPGPLKGLTDPLGLEPGGRAPRRR